ncbi:hypothetical protein D3C72_2085670 [compost metagenome]
MVLLPVLDGILYSLGLASIRCSLQLTQGTDDAFKISALEVTYATLYRLFEQLVALRQQGVG